MDDSDSEEHDDPSPDLVQVRPQFQTQLENYDLVLQSWLHLLYLMLRLARWDAPEVVSVVVLVVEVVILVLVLVVIEVVFVVAFVMFVWGMDLFVVVFIITIKYGPLCRPIFVCPKSFNNQCVVFFRLFCVAYTFQRFIFLQF